MNHLIIGAGPAGVVAAEQLRKQSPNSQITIIGDEPEPPYSRMALPYMLIDKIDEAGTFLRKTDRHFEQQRIDVVRDFVTQVDAKAKTVTLKNGGQRPYDKLLVCTGSRPIDLSKFVPGTKLPGVHNCWTLEDARHILKRANPGSTVLLIGAGFIGCIVLEALAKRDVKLIVVERGDRMVPRMMNQVAGGMIKTWCERKGVIVHASTSVTRVEAVTSQQKPNFIQKIFGGGPAPQDTGRLRVFLDNGQEYEVDLVISAAGVAPNHEFMRSSGVEIKQGIVINAFMETSLPDVYAAGDVAQGRDFSTGEYEVHAIQPTAVEHGRVAALNMCGKQTRFEGSFNMNVLDTLGLISSSFGLWQGVGGDHAEIVDMERYRYLNLEFDRDTDTLVGATSIGMTQHVGVLRGLIQGKVPLGSWRERLLDDPTQVMAAYLERNRLGMPA